MWLTAVAAVAAHAIALPPTPAPSAHQADDTQFYWKGARRLAVLLGWTDAGVAGTQNCTFESHALVHYAGSWYDVDAIENGTFSATHFRLELAKTEIGMARAEAACANITFVSPTIDALEAKLRHLVRVAHYQYESIEGYPGNDQCIPY